MRRGNVLWCSLVLVLCQCDDEHSATGPGKLVIFTVSPIDKTSIRLATPLGNLNPPGHVFPSSHIGIYLEGHSLCEVRAVSDGTIRSLHFNAAFNDYAVTVRCSRQISYYLDHVKNLTSGVVEGARVQAGDLLGYGDPAAAAVDLGVLDYDTTRHFINPARYHENAVHCGNPYLYFDAAIRDVLLAKNSRIVEPRGGKIDFDVDGALAGNWFLPETPMTYEASSYLYGANQLAFVYDMFDPAKIRICCGGTLSLAPFNYPAEGDAPDPRSVTPRSGLVKYEMSGITRSTILVQMLEGRRLKAEVFAGKKKSEVSTFTPAAKQYIR
jgi:hypothetical protein